MTSAGSQSRALTQALAGTALLKTTATPAAAFARAREIFLAGERLDMGKLAEDIGVSRATVYRWTGDREQLLADVLWAEAQSTLGWLGAQARGRGAERIHEIAAGYIDVIAFGPPIRAFLRHEGEHGVWLLTAPGGPFRPRLVQATIEIIQQEAEQGYRPPETVELLADSMVSLGERFVHNGGDPAANPSPDTAKRAIALLLRE